MTTVVTTLQFIHNPLCAAVHDLFPAEVDTSPHWNCDRLLKMWHTCLRLLAVAAVCLVFSCREAGSHALEKRGSGRRYCGKNLANILQVVCEGFYNSAFESHTKKSEDDIAIPPLEGNSEGYSGMWIDQLPEKEKEPIFPFRARPKASSLINGSFRRFTRGVYDECCVKGCTLNELASYCAIKRSQ